MRNTPLALSLCAVLALFVMDVPAVSGQATRRLATVPAQSGVPVGPVDSLGAALFTRSPRPFAHWRVPAGVPGARMESTPRVPAGVPDARMRSTPALGGRTGARTVVPAARADFSPPFRDLGGSFADFGRDTWMTLSAPVWMSAEDWLLTAGILGGGLLLYSVDEDVTRAALRNEDEPVFDQVLDVGTFFEPLGLMGKTNVWLAAGAVTSYFAGLEPPKRMFTELLYAQWIAGMMRAGTNRLVGRARPHRELGARHFELNEGTSFPSGHASTIFQIATVFAYHADWLPASIALYGIATTVCWQRIVDQQHWASDVWLGAASGWAIAKLVVRLHEEEALNVVPMTGPDGGYGLQVRIPF